MKRLFLSSIALILSINVAMCKKSESIDKVIAFVNDDVVTQSELDKQTDGLRYQLQATQQSLPSDAALKSRAMQQLIDINLQVQAAEKFQIKVSPKEVQASILAIAKRNGLSVKDLKAKLAEQNMNYTEYKRQVRREMLLSKLQREVVMRRIVITKRQLNDFIKTQYNPSKKSAAEYNLQHILISISDEPTPSDIQKSKRTADKLYQALQSGKAFDKLATTASNAEDALQGGAMGWHKLAELPQIFGQTIAHMKKGDISKPIKTSNGFHILRLKDVQNANSTHTSVKTHVRHIMMKQDDLTSNQEIKRKLNNVRDHLQRGESFAEYAELVSQDQRTVNKGGDMGWVFADELPSTLASTMQSLQLKQISTPVRSPIGWHILQVLGRKTVEDSKRLERQNARQMLFNQRLQTATQNWIKSLRGQAYIKIIKHG